MTLFILLILLPAFAQSQSARESFYEVLPKSCDGVAKSEGVCSPKNDLQQSILNTLQVSCESFRRENGCEEFEQDLLRTADAINNPRQKYSERAKVKQKIQGCTDDRICDHQSKPLFCYRGVLDAAVSNLIALPLLPLTLMKMNTDILKTPAGVLLEKIKKELGDRWNCYTPEARLELLCFLSASVIAPPGGIKAVSAAVKLKFPEIAALKSVQKIETEGATPQAIAFAGPVLPEEIKRNPQMAIWKLKQSAPAEAAKLEAEVIKKLETVGIASTKQVGIGYFNAELVTLKDGTKGIWKSDLMALNLEAAQKIIPGMSQKEQAAYAVIDKKLDMDLVPITVSRTLDGRKGSLQLYVDDVDKVTFQDYPIQFSFFDDLIGNADRHQDNILSIAGKPVAIDHGLAFSSARGTKKFRANLKESLDRLENATTKSEQELAINSIKYLMPNKKSLEKLKSISPSEWQKELEPYLPHQNVEQFLKRREEILELIQQAEQKAGKNIYPDAIYSPLIRQ